MLEGAAAVPKVQADLGAVGLNYNLGPDQLQNLYGAVTYIGQHAGQQKAGDILAGSAQVADLTKQAGFTPEQAAAMLAAVSQHSGQTPETSAADSTRVLGKGGASTFPALPQT